MPPLTKQNKKKEADFGVYLKNWVEKNPLSIPCSLELKQETSKESIPFSCLSDKQIAYANKISSNKGCWVRVVGLDGQPDYIWMINSPAYIVIKYPKVFVFITIGTFLMEKERSKRKSLTVDRALEISVKSVRLK
jgi:hypothetical protein